MTGHVADDCLRIVEAEQAAERRLVQVGFAEWVKSLHDGDPTGPSAWDGYAAAVTCDATVEALHSGRTVPVRMKDRPVFYGG